MDFIVRLTNEGSLAWYPRQEVLSSSSDHALIPIHVILTYRSSYGGARVAQTSGPPSGAVGPYLARSRGILKPDKRPSCPFYIT
jgi:hypothetical protein